MAKFLVVHPNLDIYGGGERVCHHILKALVAHGQQVELLAFDFSEKRYSEFVGEKLPNEVKVHTLGKHESVEAKPPLSMYKRRRKILQLLKTYKATARYDYTFSTQTLSAFEADLFVKAKRNIAYVHFPEIPDFYANFSRCKKLYWWLYKTQLESSLDQLGLVFCNSNYTQAAIEKYWSKLGIPEPVIAYPPVEERYWSTKPLHERAKQVVYVGRFIPQKRHVLLKQLAEEFPDYEFISIGLLRDTEEAWFSDFSKELPANYKATPNLPEPQLIQTLQDSRIYVHLMEGEHFGIAPMAALAAGCITLVHNSGGAGEIIPPTLRWNSYGDLKEKIGSLLSQQDQDVFWDEQKRGLMNEISFLKPEKFQDKIWSHVEGLMRQTENDN